MSALCLSSCSVIILELFLKSLLLEQKKITIEVMMFQFSERSYLSAFSHIYQLHFSFHPLPTRDCSNN